LLKIKNFYSRSGIESMAFPNWHDLINEADLDAQLDTQISMAKAATQAADAVEPRAQSVHFDPEKNLIVIALKNGAFFSIPPHLLQGLAGASPEDLADLWIEAGGRSVHWDRLDADFEIAGLVAGVFGTRQWMATLNSQGETSHSSQEITTASNPN
jgi:hypothetical protein